MPATLLAIASLALVSVGSVNPANLAPAVSFVSAATDTAPRCTPETLELGELTVETPKTVQLTVTNNSTSAITVEPSDDAGTLARLPPNLPTPVRAAETMTMSVLMKVSCWFERDGNQRGTLNDGIAYPLDEAQAFSLT
jgi:hypothetical protein